MAPNLDSGDFKIISLTEGNPPIGVNYTRPAFQHVYVNGPVQQWTFRRVGNNTYRLRIGGYPYTGVIDDKVIASINPGDDQEWQLTYRETQDTYTITRAEDESKGWTVSDGGEIELKPIISRPSMPPQLLPIQLFALEPSEA